MTRLDRRRFIAGAGIALGLPALDAFAPRRASAAARKIYSVFMVQANGVMQAANGEPEMFWLRNFGPLTRAGMMADSDRALSALADHASRLLICKGFAFPFGYGGCAHSGSGNQLLTAAQVSTNPSGNRSLAMGESIDNRIARELTPATEPLALYSGKKSGYIDDIISYRGALQLRAGENNPWNAYQRLVGMGAGMANPALAQRIIARRTSVNDVLRGQLGRLLARTDLSMEDRQRLDLHLSGVREVEVKLANLFSAEQTAAIKAMNGVHTDDANMIPVTRMMIDILTLALASDVARTSTLQIGTGNDHCQYVIDGVKTPPYHMISHRVLSDGGDPNAAPIPGATTLHHRIDLIHAAHFKYLLDALARYTLPSGGTLLDSSFAVWTNSVATGAHGHTNVPYVIGGSAGGFLKTGQFMSLPSTMNNKLLNTLLTAAGVRKANGDPIDDFGDRSLEHGLVRDIMA